MNTRSQKPEGLGGILTRALSASDVAIDTAARTLSFPFSSTRPVERWAWFDDGLPDGSSSIFDEILSHNPEDWNLERVEEGVCPYLKNHQRDQKLGKVISVTFEGDRGFATVKLRRCPEADQELLDLEDNVSGGVSFGYQVGKYRVLEPAEYKGEGWDRRLIKKAVLEGVNIMLFEVSAADIPADPSVGFGKSARSGVDLRTVQLEGDPHWEAERATPAELKQGDWVAWNSSGGTSKGRIETVATSGTVQAVPKGPSMEGTPENPAYLVVVWTEADDASWKPTTTKVVKRAANLTEIASLKSLTGGAERQSKPNPKRTKPVGKRTKQQTRELTIADYLTVAEPELDDLLQAFKDTVVAIEAAVAEDDTLDMPALCQSAIDDLHARLYTLYEISSSDNATDDAGTDTGAPAMDGERAAPQRSAAELQRDRDFKNMQEKLAQMERKQAVTETLTQLREQAVQLRDTGKMTPAEFNDKFGDVGAAIEKYVKADDSAVKADDSALKSLTERLADIETYAEPVAFGAKLRNEPLTPPKAASVHDAELEDYKKSKG